MLVALLLSAAIAAAPAPSPAPLRTIVHARVSPLCTALRENIGHAISAVLANDSAIEASKPVFVSMSYDNMTPDQVETIGLGNVHGSMTIDHNSAAMQLDTQHIETIIGAITHNLKLIDEQLKDSSRFPQDPKTADDKKLLEMRAQLEAVAAQQRQTLNVLEGIVDTRTMDALSDRGADVVNLFGLNEGHNSKISGSNQQFAGGPLTATPDQLMDPALKPSDFSTLKSSVYGRFYSVVYWEQSAIHQLESPLAQNVMETTRQCRGS